MKRFINILLSLILITGLFTVMSLAESRHKKQLCKDFQVLVPDRGHKSLIAANEIRAMVMDLEDSIVGKPIHAIDLELISQRLSSNVYIESFDVCTSVNGILKIRINPRIPLVRIINQQRQQYLMDVKGNILPYSERHPVRVLIASGHIVDHFNLDPHALIPIDSIPDESIVKCIFKLATDFASDPFTESLIDQMFITEAHEFELVPKIGDQIILFGDMKDHSKKIGKLRSVYEDIFPEKGWDYYKSINLKFENQVVCTK